MLTGLLNLKGKKEERYYSGGIPLQTGGWRGKGQLLKKQSPSIG